MIFPQKKHHGPIMGMSISTCCAEKKRKETPKILGKK
jgi:hypothetical protein